MRNKRRIETILLILVLVIFSLQIYTRRERFTKPYDYSYLADKYLHSQYVEGEGSKYILSDYELYAYAGYFYITGGEISRVNFENPPLGKYLIGISIILWRNPLVIYLVYAGVYLVIAYKFGMWLFNKRLIALGGLLILVVDPYFIHAVTYTHLDFPMATFFLLGLYSVVRATDWKKYLVASIFFGLALATKFFPFFAVILAYLLFVIRTKGKRVLTSFALTIPAIGFVYALTFWDYLRRHGLGEFLHYQWWVIRWRMGNPIVVGNILQSVFFGRLVTWWEKTPAWHYYPEEWSPIMPAVVVIGLVSVILFHTRKRYRIIYGYLILFVLYIFFVTEGGLKYLAPLYLFFALFSSAVFFHLLKKAQARIKEPQ